MKYKVGDKVRVREDLVVWESYGNLECLPGHKEYFGRIFRIKAISGKDYQLNEEYGFWWSEEMLEEVDEMKEKAMRVERIEIISDGKNVRAILGQKVAVAKCSPEDEFDIFVGAKLALERLEKQCKPYAWLKEGVKYYFPNALKDDLHDYYIYNNDDTDKRLVSRGLVFKTKEEAIATAKKMLAVLKEKEA